MKSRYSVLLCLLLPLFVSAQWYESFNDGHLNLWTGDVTEFKVNQETNLIYLRVAPVKAVYSDHTDTVQTA